MAFTMGQWGTSLLLILSFCCLWAAKVAQVLPKGDKRDEQLVKACQNGATMLQIYVYVVLCVFCASRFAHKTPNGGPSSKIYIYIYIYIYIQSGLKHT